MVGLTQETTEVARISAAYLDEANRLDPIMATFRGASGFDDQITNYSPDGHEARAELMRRTKAELAGAKPSDEADRIGQQMVLRMLDDNLRMIERGERYGQIDILFSPPQFIASVLRISSPTSREAREALAARLRGVPAALDGYAQSLQVARDRGIVAARRQVEAVASQLETWAGDGESSPLFDAVIAPAERDDEMTTAVAEARSAYMELALVLRSELLADAPAEDGIGGDRYEAWSQYFLASEVDPHDAYAWGWDELARIRLDRDSTANEVLAGASYAEVCRHLNQESDLVVEGPDAYRDWYQERTDQAIAALDGVHFDIPDQIRECRCELELEGSAAAPHYSPPALDGSRPGKVWLPTMGNVRFPLWNQLTGCFHEGVPGHHLELGLQRAAGAHLNPVQRTSIVSAYSEGWALYAERLMDELGFLDRPEFRLGYLSFQALRAARVVVDIGLHLRLDIPAGWAHAGERWTAEIAEQFLMDETGVDRGFAHSEVIRYLGLPAQATSYKLGERMWVEGRDAARARAGNSFDLKEFHRRALSFGAVGLDQLRDELARL